MQENKNIIISLILLGIFFLCVTFAVVWHPSFSLSAEKFLGATAKELREQIKLLVQQVEALLVRLAILQQTEESKEALTPDSAPPVLSNLEPEHVIANSGLITWGTDELSDSMVTYSTKFIDRYISAEVLIATNPNLVTHHEVQLEGLNPNTMYYYYVTSTDPSGNTSSSNTHTIITLSE